MIDEAFEAAAECLACAAAEIDRTGEVPSGLLNELAMAGWFGWNVPLIEAGTDACSHLALGRKHARVGRICSSVRAVLGVHQMVCEALMRWGDEAQKRRWLPELASGHTLAAFALTEPECGSDASAVRTAIVEHGGELEVTGRKRWITAGTRAGLLLVCGRMDQRYAAVLVPVDAPGVVVRPVRGLHGLRGAMVADVDLDSVIVPASMRIGPRTEGMGFVAAHALDLGRLLVAWGAAGICDAMLARALVHARSRVQFGSVLAGHQLVQRRLTDMYCAVRQATLLCESASRMRDDNRPEALQETLVAKYTATACARASAQAAVALLGARGLHEGEPAERFLRDSAVLELIEGSPEMNQIHIARGLDLVG